MASTPRGGILIALAFVALTYAYVTSDFSVENVWANSHSDKPLLYKISGVWGNHEGSMLLWVLILALFGAAVAFYGTNLPDSLRANVLAVQAGIAVAFLAFIVLASNPFTRIPLQPEGRGLNPILQDPALSFHPPFLYAGYVGLSVPLFLPEVLPAAEVGWRFSPAAWGRGYATEGATAALDQAFTTLGLDEVVSVPQADNPASRRVAERLGMTLAREVVIPASDLRGEVTGALYELARDDWARRRPAPWPNG